MNSNSIQSRTGAGTQEQMWFEYDGHAGGWLVLKAKVSFRGEYPEPAYSNLGQGPQPWTHIGN